MLWCNLSACRIWSNLITCLYIATSWCVNANMHMWNVKFINCTWRLEPHAPPYTRRAKKSSNHIWVHLMCEWLFKYCCRCVRVCLIDCVQNKVEMSKKIGIKNEFLWRGEVWLWWWIEFLHLRPRSLQPVLNGTEPEPANRMVQDGSGDVERNRILHVGKNCIGAETSENRTAFMQIARVFETFKTLTAFKPHI